MIIPETKAPLTLHSEQRAVLDAFNERDSNGDFLRSLWLYSAPKKSAKTTICAGLALWQAWRVPDGEIYIIGNDQKQADNRMAQAIRYCIDHHPQMKQRAHITTSKYTIKLDNGTRIEAIPVDPRGEAGMNPTGIFWTETWGAKGERAELLWSEAALSPLKMGQAIKVVESYAGYTGESQILERLYDAIVKNGQPSDTLPEVYTTQGAIAYWCTRRYLSWQVNAAAYYAQEAAEKTPSEFRRVHGNEWVSSEDNFVPVEWWTACETDVPPLGENQSLVIGIDAAVDSDNFAVVAVSREGVDKVAVRYVGVWKPPVNGKIDFSEPEKELRRLCAEYNVIQIAYDPYQLADMAGRMKDTVWMNEFKQGQPRLIADKTLYDVIRERRLMHSGEPALTEHVKNANRKPDDGHLRIIKRAPSLKIDACVALSMATFECLRLNL